MWLRGVGLSYGFVGPCGAADRRFLRENAGVEQAEWLRSADTAERRGREQKLHLILADALMPFPRSATRAFRLRQGDSRRFLISL
jgi:hypothetical protein